MSIPYPVDQPVKFLHLFYHQFRDVSLASHIQADRLFRLSAQFADLLILQTSSLNQTGKLFHVPVNCDIAHILLRPVAPDRPQIFNL